MGRGCHRPPPFVLHSLSPPYRCALHSLNYLPDLTEETRTPVVAERSQIHFPQHSLFFHFTAWLLLRAPGRGHRGMRGPDPLPLRPLSDGGPPEHPEGLVCAHVRGRGGPSRHQERKCAQAFLPGALPIRHTAAFAADVTATQRATWNALVGTPTSDAA